MTLSKEAKRKLSVFIRNYLKDRRHKPHTINQVTNAVRKQKGFEYIARSNVSICIHNLRQQGALHQPGDNDFQWKKGPQLAPDEWIITWCKYDSPTWVTLSDLDKLRKYQKYLLKSAHFAKKPTN